MTVKKKDGTGTGTGTGVRDSVGEEDDGEDG
jgi:hypothetical protein